MAENLSGSLSFLLSGMLRTTVGLITASAPLTQGVNVKFTAGTGAGQANTEWSDMGTLAAAPITYTFRGGSLLDPMGIPINVSKAKLLLILNQATADGSNITVSPGVSNGWTGLIASGSLIVPASGGIIAWGFLASGMPMDATHCTLKLDPGSATIPYSVALIAVE